jgi:hypothetical protein
MDLQLVPSCVDSSSSASIEQPAAKDVAVRLLERKAIGRIEE